MNLTSVNPPQRPAHSFFYNLSDFATGSTTPDGGEGEATTAYAYNTMRDLTRVTRPSGAVANYTYTRGQLTRVTSPEGAETFDYDNDSGSVTSQRSASGIEQTFEHDGPLVTEADQPGVPNSKITYQHDDLLRTSSLTIAGQEIPYTYDDDSLLTAAGELSIGRVAANGLPSGTALQNLTTSTSYNSFGEPAEEAANLPGGAGFNSTYQRDAAGRITKKTETTGAGSTTWDYEYSPEGRLSAAYKDNALYATYAYDQNGNRASYSQAGDVATATFDNRDRMRTQGQEVFTYNKNGELTARENTQTGKTAAYTYDTFGNMTGASTEDGRQISYKLDADANRATREVDGQVQARFIYAPGIQGPVAELAGDNTLRARYVYASRSNVPDYMVRNGNTYRLLTDQLGSVRMVVDASSGQVAQEIEYDPFGSITRDTNEGFQPFGFAGGLYDPATGLTHFGAREYDAGMGRWTAGDPIGFAGGDANLYGYVIRDPVNLVDPSGLFFSDVFNAAKKAGKFVYENLDTIAMVTAAGVCVMSGPWCATMLFASTVVSGLFAVRDFASGKTCFTEFAVDMAIAAIPSGIGKAPMAIARAVPESKALTDLLINSRGLGPSIARAKLQSMPSIGSAVLNEGLSGGWSSGN